MYPSPGKTPMKTIGGKRKYRSRVGKYVSKRFKTGTVKMNKRFQLGKFSKRPKFISKKTMRSNIPKKYQLRRSSNKSISSNSTGFFEVPNSSQSKNIRTLDTFAKQGVTCTTEFNGTFDWSTEMGVVTQLSMAEEERRLIFCKAILKKFAVKFELDYEDETKPAFQAGNLRLYYRTTTTSETSSVLIFDNNTGGSNPAWLTIANNMNAAFKTLFVTTDYMYLTALELSRSGLVANPYYGNDMHMDLRFAKIEFYEKCTVKIQNRTLSQDGDDNAEAVDNVPIYGKIIRGNGCNPQYSSWWKGTSAGTIVPFEVSQITGNGLTIPSGLTQNSMQEPPSYKRIKYATGESKLHLDPGNIKTMACSFRKTVSLDNACKNLYVRFNEPVTGTRNINSIGLWTQFYMEKMINVDAASSVRIALESNTAAASQIKLKRTLYTQPYFKKLADPIIP